MKLIHGRNQFAHFVALRHVGKLYPMLWIGDCTEQGQHRQSCVVSDKTLTSENLTTTKVCVLKTGTLRVLEDEQWDRPREQFTTVRCTCVYLKEALGTHREKSQESNVQYPTMGVNDTLRTAIEYLRNKAFIVGEKKQCILHAAKPTDRHCLSHGDDTKTLSALE